MVSQLKIFVLALASSWFILLTTGAVAAQRPNIVFILADDLGYGDLGCYGQKNFATPAIDRLAAQGMRFTQHYAGSTVCGPSRACLMTGQHTGHGTQRANGNVGLRPDPDDATVARLLKDAGYSTALIGKSPFLRDDEGRLPNAKGFDHFFGYATHTAAHRYYPEFLLRNGERVEYADNHGKEGRQYSSDLILADALAYIESHTGAPFFLHIAFQTPHADLNAPAKWREPFVGQFAESPFESDRHYRSETHPKATFAGMVAHLDDAVGQVLDKLHEQGVAENTIVLLSSDNGAMSEGGWSREYFQSSGPLRGGKRDLYEGGVRVPLIAWWPETIAAGATSDHISAFWDFLPTACGLAGVDPPKSTDGLSYLPTLLGKPADQQRHDYLYWEFYEQGGKQAVRRGNWKAVRRDVFESPDRELELYDLSKDVGETHDVAADHPEVVAELNAIFREAHVDAEEFKMPPPK